jgi:Na+-translocating ferredoxin:NAD+ oxidoreductase subunit E
MNNINWSEITLNGLWKNNPGLVQLLGLCPLLAVSGSVVNALGMGVATMLVLAGSNLAVSVIRNAVSDAVRLPVFVMIIAAFTTCTELLMQAYAYELYQILGIFIPLIVTNCIILGRADAFAAKNPPLAATFDGLMMGLGFTLVLVVLGSVREILGSGTWLANMHLLFGESAKDWTVLVFGVNYPGFLVAILPPGAFMVMGLIIALKNILDARIQQRIATQKVESQTPKVNRRVRTTGNIA